GEDVLAFSNDGTMGNITASFDAAHGTLTLVSAGGTATLAQWQAALRSVTYTDTAVTPDTTTRSIGFTINDGVKTSAALERSVSVTATHQTPLLGVDGTQLSYTAGGRVTVPVSVGAGITLTDLNATAPTTATIAFSGAFDAQHDVLSFAAGAATGDIAASFDAAHGTLTLHSASGNATLAQWQAALTAVGYLHTQAEHTGSTRTLVFTVGDGVKTSAPLTRTLTIVGTAQPVGTPILPQWVLPHDQNGQPDREQTGAMPIGLPHAAPLLADDSLGQSDGVSSPLIVLDAFGATSQRDVGSIGTRDTFTFASHGARERSLGDTHVRPLDSLVPAGIEGATPAAHPLAPIDVHPLHRAGQDFAVNVRTLVQTPATRDAQAPGADDAAVTAVTLANGAPLPAWLHYDAQSGVLSGKPPAGVHDVRVTLVQRDAAGNLVRREVTMRFDAHGNAAGKPAEHGKGNGHAVAPHAQAAPLAKPSLAAQFANALATLHVTGERRS
ncbi:putative Ig domain-containing protein, partial [Burkholderia vietnamiensis]